jgi:hypothetical protein
MNEITLLPPLIVSKLPCFPFLLGLLCFWTKENEISSNAGVLYSFPPFETGGLY